MEGSWGLETLEVPQSSVCAGEAFQWFAAHLLARLPEFHAIHNEAVREYRRAHRVRSLSHPVPELAEDGGLAGGPAMGVDGRRAPSPASFRPLDRRRNRPLRSAVVGGPVAASAEGDAGRAVERLLELQHGGVRIRSRALVTTLWARLALGDLFIHGIGGAKYDRVTDLLMERFFGLHPPGFHGRVGHLAAADRTRPGHRTTTCGRSGGNCAI